MDTEEGEESKINSSGSDELFQKAASDIGAAF